MSGGMQVREYNYLNRGSIITHLHLLGMCGLREHCCLSKDIMTRFLNQKYQKFTASEGKHKVGVYRTHFKLACLEINCLGNTDSKLFLPIEGIFGEIDPP